MTAATSALSLVSLQQVQAAAGSADGVTVRFRQVSTFAPKRVMVALQAVQKRTWLDVCTVYSVEDWKQWLYLLYYHLHHITSM